MKWVVAFIVLVIIELGLFLIVNLQRRGFQWLITEKDEVPILDARALEKYLGGSFDPHLGWVRRPIDGRAGSRRPFTSISSVPMDGAGTGVAGASSTSQ